MTNRLSSERPVLVNDSPSRQSRWAAIVASIDPSSERGRESLALALGAITLPVVALITLAVFRLQSLPIGGEGSIGQYGAVASAFVAMVTFAAGHSMVVAPSGGRRRVLDVLDIAVLAFAHAVIALLTWTLLAVILDRGFVDAVVFGIPSALAAGTMTALTAYVAFYSATHMDLGLLAAVLALFLVEGVIASMLTASDPYWWKHNLSALGMTDDASAVTFNVTLVVGGLIVTTLARYATRGLAVSHKHGAARVQGSLILIGILLALVGLFPADAFYWVHTGFASAMAVVFGVLVTLLPRWIPEMPGAFVALGWLFIAIVGMLFVLFAIGYYNLTAVELVGGVIFFAWIILFIQNAAAIERDSRKDGANRSAPSAEKSILDSAEGTYSKCRSS